MPRRHAVSRRAFLARSATAVSGTLLTGCLFPTDEKGPVNAGDPRLTARPGTPTIEPGYGLSALGFEYPRDGFLYIPSTYSPDTAAPLLVALHGAGGKSSDWNTYQSRAKARGMILLCPDSRYVTWDLVGGGYGSDVRFLDRALAHTFERCRIDPARIALAGFSDGASYALSLGMSNGDLFTDLIAYSPGFYTQTEPVVGQPHVFVSHGTSDPVLSFERTRDVIVSGLQDLGYDTTFLEFDGGHEVTADVTTGALEWFLGPV